MIASIGTSAHENTAWNIRNRTTPSSTQPPDRVHHDRVDAVLEAAHRDCAGSDDGEDAAHLVLQVGRRARFADVALAPPTVDAAPWRDPRLGRVDRPRRRLEQREQRGVAVGAHRDRLDHRAAELGGELVDVDDEAFGAGDVGHVERDHQRPAELRELEHQAQVHAQVGRVDDGDDRVGRRLAVAPAFDHLERDLLVGRRRRQAVRSRAGR